MRIFDCFLYNGEIEALLQRLNELHEAVDVFVIVEATKTFNGESKTLHLRAQWAKVRVFARKIRYVVIADESGPGCAKDREGFQRNCIMRGLLDALDSDLICISAVKDIPSAEVIAKLRDAEQRFVGLTAYLSLINANSGGTEKNLASFGAFSKRALEHHSPTQLYDGIRNGSIVSDQLDDDAHRPLDIVALTELALEIPVRSLPDSGSTPPSPACATGGSR